MSSVRAGQLNRRIVQRIEHRQKAFAGYAERVLHAVRNELVDDDLSASAQHCLGRGRGSWGGAHDNLRVWV